MADHLQKKEAWGQNKKEAAASTGICYLVDNFSYDTFVNCYLAAPVSLAEVMSEEMADHLQKKEARGQNKKAAAGGDGDGGVMPSVDTSEDITKILQKQFGFSDKAIRMYLPDNDERRGGQYHHLQKKEAGGQNKKDAPAVQCVVCGQVGPA